MRKLDSLISPLKKSHRDYAWLEGGAFWGFFSSSIAFVALALTIGNTNRLFAHIAFIAAWPCAIMAFGRIIIAGSHRWRLQKSAFFVTISGLFLYSIDMTLIKAARSHIRITHAALLRAQTDQPFEVAVAFANDGDEPTTDVRLYRAIGIAPFDSTNAKFQAERENVIFALALSQVGLYEIANNKIEPHSTERNFQDRTHVPATSLSMVPLKSGNAALYFTGRILCHDGHRVTHHTDFCFLWQKDISIGSELDFCHTHNEAP